MKGLGNMQFMSFLDLMCCGMGGGLLLLLIMAAARPVQAPPNPLVVIRCHVADADSPRAELGLRFREPGGLQWKRCDARNPVASQAVFFSATSEQESGGEVMLALVRPAAGVWQFQPYLVDFPAGKTSARPILVELDAVGQAVDGRASREESSESSTLVYPGDFGDVWVVAISGN